MSLPTHLYLEFPAGSLVTTSDIIDRFRFDNFNSPTGEYSLNYLRSFLPNSEVNSTHSPTYSKLVRRG